MFIAVEPWFRCVNNSNTLSTYGLYYKESIQMNEGTNRLFYKLAGENDVQVFFSVRALADR